MAVIVSGTDLYKKAQKLLQEPTSKDPFVDYEKAFHWFNVLLNGAYEHNDISIPNLYFAIGAASLKRDHRILALLCFQKAIELDPELFEAINNVAYVYKKLEMEEEAKYYFKRVLDLALEKKDEQLKLLDKEKGEQFIKEIGNFYANYGSMFVARGTPDEALALFEEGIKYHPEDTMLRYNKSLALLEKGDYINGFCDNDLGDRVTRLNDRNYGHDKLPWWDGTPGKKVVVIGEQGIGDEIMFGTLLPFIMRDCGVVFDFHPRLIELFRRAYPNVDIYGTRKDESDIWGKRYAFDAKIMLGSLPKFYIKSKDDFLPAPYLKADPALSEKYRLKLDEMGDRPKIGISWRGGSHLTNRRHIPLDLWVDLLKLPADFISLQYDKNIEEQVAKFEKENDVCINHWPDVLEDYDETAGLVANLDLIVTVPQSIVHLAGAMGKPVMQLCPKKAMWQMGVYGEDMPWYSSVRNIWQEEDGNWKPVMDKIKGQLIELMDKTQG